MLKKTNIFIFIAFVWIGVVSLNNPSNKVEIPAKKINKAITKIWKVDEFEVIDHDFNNEKNCFKNGSWLKVTTNGANLGMIYIGRVNSCRSGGCAVDSEPQSLAFEFFDYFLLADTNGQVLWVKIFNYQATQGHEVMSRGWLNQFKGLTKDENVVLGQDIEAISGATVSATAITEDIQQVLGCVNAFH
jgi:Na+-translocating ferredoxin:NAD+ oxidoreductase RnfG subunit